jgi:hypothetical protein
MYAQFAFHWKRNVLTIFILSLLLLAVIRACSSTATRDCISEVYHNKAYSFCNTAKGAQIMYYDGTVELQKGVVFREMKQLGDFMFISMRSEDNYCSVMISDGNLLPRATTAIKDVSQITFLTKQGSGVLIHYTHIDPKSNESVDAFFGWALGAFNDDPPYKARPHCDE